MKKKIIKIISAVLIIAFTINQIAYAADDTLRPAATAVVNIRQTRYQILQKGTKEFPSDSALKITIDKTKATQLFDKYWEKSVNTWDQVCANKQDKVHLIAGALIELGIINLDETNIEYIRKVYSNLFSKYKHAPQNNEKLVRIDAAWEIINRYLKDVDMLLPAGGDKTSVKSFPTELRNGSEGKRDALGNVYIEYVRDPKDKSCIDHVRLRNIKTGEKNIRIIFPAKEGRFQTYIIDIDGNQDSCLVYDYPTHHLQTIYVKGEDEGVAQTVINWLARRAKEAGDKEFRISPIKSPKISHLARRSIKDLRIEGEVDPMNVEYLVLDRDFNFLSGTEAHEIGTVGVYDGKIARDFTYKLPSNLEPVVRNGRLIILNSETEEEADVIILYHYSEEDIRGKPNPIVPVFREDGVIERWQGGVKIGEINPKGETLKAPNEDALTNEERRYIESIIIESEPVEVTDGARRVLEEVCSSLGERAPPFDKIRIHKVTYPDTKGILGLPRIHDPRYTLSPKDLIYAYGKRNQAILHIYLTESFYNKHLVRNDHLFAEIIDHEWNENILLLSHADTYKRCQRFSNNRYGISEFQKFYIDLLAKAGDLRTFSAFEEEHENDPERQFINYAKRAYAVIDLDEKIEPSPISPIAEVARQIGISPEELDTTSWQSDSKLRAVAIAHNLLAAFIENAIRRSKDSEPIIPEKELEEIRRLRQAGEDIAVARRRFKFAYKVARKHIARTEGLRGAKLRQEALSSNFARGNRLNIDPLSIRWKWVINLDTEVLKQIEVATVDDKFGYPLDSGFIAAKDSEIMDIVRTSRGLDELKEMLGRIVVAETFDGRPVTAEDIGIVGAMVAVLKDVIRQDDRLDSAQGYMAKIDPKIEGRLRDKLKGKYILVTAMNPTEFGEGKTVTTIGLSMALNRLGKKCIATPRQPSMGPVFGKKGGGTGGGESQVFPAEDINLHFTGDMHAVTEAHNLLTNKIFEALRDNRLNINPASITWPWAMDLNARPLKNIRISKIKDRSGNPLDSRFVITAASEVMAILALSKDFNDMKEGLKRIVVAETYDGREVTAEDLGVVEDMADILRNAIKLNLVQTLEGTPVIIHTGPFGNIAHGNGSIIADRIALGLVGEDGYVVTEAGFGADLGAEKFFDIKCRESGLKPDCAVIVCTLRALKLHSGRYGKLKGDELIEELNKPNMEGLREGFANLKKHIENVKIFGVPVVVAINRFPTDTNEELIEIIRLAKEAGADESEISEVYARGGEGGEAVAQAVMRASEKPKNFKFLYEDDMSIKDKIERIAKKIYGAGEVKYSPQAEEKIRLFEERGYSRLPICMAKTQYSLSGDPKKLGRPEGFVLEIRDVQLSAGAGFIYPICGDVQIMPGLPTDAAGYRIDIDGPTRRILGIFSILPAGEPPSRDLAVPTESRNVSESESKTVPAPKQDLSPRDTFPKSMPFIEEETAILRILQQNPDKTFTINELKDAAGLGVNEITIKYLLDDLLTTGMIRKIEPAAETGIITQLTEVNRESAADLTLYQALPNTQGYAVESPKYSLLLAQSALRPVATMGDEIKTLQEALKQAKKEDEYNPQYFINMARKNPQHACPHIIEAVAAIKRLPAGNEFFISQEDIKFIKTILAYREQISHKETPEKLKIFIDRILSFVNYKVKSADRYKHLLDREFKGINTYLGKVLAETISQMRQDFFKHDARLHQLIEQESAIMQYLFRLKGEIPKGEDAWTKAINQLTIEDERQQALKTLAKIKQDIKIYRQLTAMRKERLNDMMLHIIKMAELGLINFIRVNPNRLEEGNICIVRGEILVFEGRAEGKFYSFTAFDYSGRRGMHHLSIIEQRGQWIKLDTGDINRRDIIPVDFKKDILPAQGLSLPAKITIETFAQAA